MSLQAEIRRLRALVAPELSPTAMRKRVEARAEETQETVAAWLRGLTDEGFKQFVEALQHGGGGRAGEELAHRFRSLAGAVPDTPGRRAVRASFRATLAGLSEEDFRRVLEEPHLLGRLPAPAA